MRRQRPPTPLEGVTAPGPPTSAKPAAPRLRDSQKRTPLGDLLVEAGLVAPAKLNEALLQQEAAGKRIGALLVELGDLDERQLTEVLGRQLEISVIDLRSEEPDAETAALLPEPIARALTAIPVRQEDGRVDVAVADPLDDEVVQRLRQEIPGE